MDHRSPDEYGDDDVYFIDKAVIMMMMTILMILISISVSRMIIILAIVFIMMVMICCNDIHRLDVIDSDRALSDNVHCC